MRSSDEGDTARLSLAHAPAPDEETRRIPRARSGRHGRLYVRRPAGRAEASPGRGVAPVPRDQEPTRPLTPPAPPARPIFVDDSGRRARLLAWAALLVALAALVLIVLFWVSQATASSPGGPRLCGSGPADRCPGAAGP